MGNNNLVSLLMKIMLRKEYKIWHNYSLYGGCVTSEMHKKRSFMV